MDQLKSSFSPCDLIENSLYKTLVENKRKYLVIKNLKFTIWVAKILKKHSHINDLNISESKEWNQPFIGKVLLNLSDKINDCTIKAIAQFEIFFHFFYQFESQSMMIQLPSDILKLYNHFLSGQKKITISEYNLELDFFGLLYSERSNQPIIIKLEE